MSDGSKTWVFTLNNYIDDDIKMMHAWQSEINRMVVAREQGESGTPHLQGQITFKRKYRLGALKKLQSKAHWEPAKAAQDSLYCMKEGSDVIINVDNRRQGKRNDIVDYVAAIKEGKSDVELINSFPSEYIKFSRTDKVRMMLDKEATRPFRKLEVIVRYGKTGTGKSRAPYEEGAFRFTDWDNLWWDGYEGEPIICLEEFYGQVKPTWLLNVLDGYQLKLKIKNGFTWAKWTKVYITSNDHPDNWYKSDKIPEDVRAAIKRRITRVDFFGDEESPSPQWTDGLVVKKNSIGFMD